MGSAVEALGAGDPVVEGFIRLSPDAALVVAADGVIRAANALAAEMFGIPLARLVGANVDAFVPAEARGKHAHLREGFNEHPNYRRMGAGLDLRVARPDGTEFPADISLAPVASPAGAGHVVVTIRDLSELRRSERAATRLAAVVQASDAAILSTTPDRVIDSWNPAAERMLGFAADDVAGRPLDLLVPEEVREAMALIYQRVAAGDHVDLFDTWRQRRDGSRVEVAVSVSGMWDRRGQLVGFCEVLRDVTERRRVQAELAAAQADRQVFADRERLARDLHDVVIQRVFAAGLIVQGVMSAVQMPPLQDRLQRVVAELDSAVRDIRTSIFTLRRNPSEAGSLRGRLVDLSTSLAPVLTFTPELQFHGQVDLQVSDERADDVLAVVREALTNVAKHARATAAQVTVSSDAETLYVEVRDDGQGLGETSRRSGLANMRERAERVGGTFEVISEPNAGTRLLWQVPLTDG